MPIVTLPSRLMADGPLVELGSFSQISDERLGLETMQNFWAGKEAPEAVNSANLEPSSSLFFCVIISRVRIVGSFLAHSGAGFCLIPGLTEAYWPETREILGRFQKSMEQANSSNLQTKCHWLVLWSFASLA